MQAGKQEGNPSLTAALGEKENASAPPLRTPEQATASRAPSEAAPAPARGEPAAQPDSGLPSGLKMLASVVAPTSLATGLLFYFGQAHVQRFFRYFGIDTSLIAFTTQDYLLRSVDALFVPLTVSASVGLALLFGHVAVRTRLIGEARLRALRLLTLVLAITGLLLFGIGMAGVFYETVFEFHLLVSPLSLALGVGLLVYASYLRRASRRLEKPLAPMASTPGWVPAMQAAALFVLVGLSLFWAATDYAAAVGVARAREFERRLDERPDVVLYSERDLQLQAPGVTKTTCSGEDAAYGFRYEGLKLMLRSDDKLFFLPATWRQANGVAIVIPESDSLRLEFSPRTTARDSPPDEQSRC